MSRSPAEEATGRPRLLEIDLAALGRGESSAVRRREWSSSDALLDRVGGWSGPAAALALFLECDPSRAPFVLAVGDCVRLGLPTAARATVMARSPLTGRLAEGQVGSDLGRRLVSLADVIVLDGEAQGTACVLHLGLGPDGQPSVELVDCDELVGLDPHEVPGRLQRRFGAGTSLRVGPAGSSGVPFANLAAGAEPASFVGRGGLGAALGARGLRAVYVSAEPVEGSGAPDLVDALLDSPRLMARADGGTFELAHALSARGDLRGHGEREVLDPGAGARLADEVRGSASGRQGCRGCPTPCGWVFERQDGGRSGARFGAVHALGQNLGLDSLDDALALLEVCNHLGLDAKEAGAVLALHGRACELGRLPETAAWGDREALEDLLVDLVRGRGAGLRLRQGAAALAADLDLAGEAFVVGGEAARPAADMAALLGECVAARGAEPVRTLPFLVGEGSGRARIEALLGSPPVPVGAEDPASPAGKGRLVWWHENLVAAVDASGFCAFSAAALLADGTSDLDQFAAWVAPTRLPVGEGEGPGRAFLATGATLIGLHRELARRWECTIPEPPAWAEELLGQAGMLDSYRAHSGLDPEGRLTEAARDRLGTLELLSLSDGNESAPEPDPSAGPAVVAGSVKPGSAVLRAIGPLGEALGPEATLRLPLPTALLVLLESAANRWPAAAPLLLRDGAPLPAVYRAGRRLGPADLVDADDELDLVLAVSGG